MPVTPRKDGVKPKLSIEALQKTAVNLEIQNKSLEKTNRSLGNELVELRSIINKTEAKRTPELSIEIQQTIVNLRDDAEYFSRRSEEANTALLKYLRQIGENGVDIQVVIAKDSVESSKIKPAVAN